MLIVGNKMKQLTRLMCFTYDQSSLHGKEKNLEFKVQPNHKEKSVNKTSENG